MIRRPRRKNAREPRTGLRYTLQVKDGLRWRTVKSYRPEVHDFRILERMVFLGANKWDRRVRLLLMPYNIVAVISF